MIKLFDFISGTRLRKQNVYFQYSTEEQFTGEYWIDGKKIYQKTVIWESSATGVVKKAHGITNISTIVDYKTIARNMDGKNFYTFSKVYYANGTGGTFYDTDITINTTEITYFTNTSYASHTFYTTIKYTKK